jgi:hypothetical protein
LRDTTRFQQQQIAAFLIPCTEILCVVCGTTEKTYQNVARPQDIFYELGWRYYPNAQDGVGVACPDCVKRLTAESEMKTDG